MLIDEVRGDLASLSADDLVPPLRRGQALQVTALEDAARLSGRSAVAIARLADGRAIYVPLVLDRRWRRAEPHDAISADALAAPAPFVLHELCPPPDFDRSREHSLDVDMSNDIRIIDDLVVAKWQLLAEAGSLAGPRMIEHLAAAGFTEMPEPLASVSWRGHLVVAFTAFLPQADDGWDWMLDDVRGMLEGTLPAPEWPTRLGSLTGRLHAAAATPTTVLTQPIGRADLAPLARHYRDLLTADLDAEMRAALAPWADRFEHACDVVEAATDAEVIPVHGDLHPGQFLRWRDGIAVSDFDGNPLLPAQQRDLRGPTAHDVAGLLRGFDHVAIAAARRVEDPKALAESRAWARSAREAALSAYLSVEGVPGLDHSLLEALESLSPLHEAVYASAYLPRWRYVPLAVLRGGW